MSVFTIYLIAALLHSVSADSSTSDPAGAISGFVGLIILGICIYYCRCCCCGRSQQNVVIVNQAAPAPPPPAYVQFV